MKHLEQDKEDNCGQTCIAMVSYKSIRDIENVVGHDKGMNMKETILACKCLGISIGKKWVMKKWGKKIGRYLLPFNCFILVIYKYKNKVYGHLIVRNKGKFLDPDGKESYFLKKHYIIKGYLRIK